MGRSEGPGHMVASLRRAWGRLMHDRVRSLLGGCSREISLVYRIRHDDRPQARWGSGVRRGGAPRRAGHAGGAARRHVRLLNHWLGASFDLGALYFVIAAAGAAQRPAVPLFEKKTTCAFYIGWMSEDGRVGLAGGYRRSGR
jgi:hypothetical protein